MKIEDINEESEDIDVEATVEKIEPTRAVSTKYGQGKLALAEIDDGTGSIELVLWGEQVDRVDEGDKIKVNSAFVRAFEDYLQLSIPREGSVEVIS